jgi:polyhydroxyalkanoate synthesis regulator phasin
LALFKTEKNELSTKIRPLDCQKKASEEAYPKHCGYYLWVVSGAKGSGKTTLLYNVLLHHLKGYYDNIYLISTTAKNDKKMTDLVDELSEEDKIYTECSPDVISEVIEKIQEKNDEGAKNNLVWFDDCIHLLPKSTQKNSVFNKLITTMRHYKTDVWITTQSYLRLNTLVRSNMDLFSIPYQ